MQISHQPYTLENKNVFSLDLKILTEEACLMDSGKAFQSLGAAIQKARSPLHLRLDLGVNNRSWLDDRRDLIYKKKGASRSHRSSSDYYKFIIVIRICAKNLPTGSY